MTQAKLDEARAIAEAHPDRDMGRLILRNLMLEDALREVCKVCEDSLAVLIYEKGYVEAKRLLTQIDKEKP